MTDRKFIISQTNRGHVVKHYNTSTTDRHHCRGLEKSNWHRRLRLNVSSLCVAWRHSPDTFHAVSDIHTALAARISVVHVQTTNTVSDINSPAWGTDFTVKPEYCGSSRLDIRCQLYTLPDYVSLLMSFWIETFIWDTQSSQLTSQQMDTFTFLSCISVCNTFTYIHT